MNKDLLELYSDYLLSSLGLPRFHGLLIFKLQHRLSF
jgi:hypothetical protein